MRRLGLILFILLLGRPLAAQDFPADILIGQVPSYISDEVYTGPRQLDRGSEDAPVWIVMTEPENVIVKLKDPVAISLEFNMVAGFSPQLYLIGDEEPVGGAWGTEPDGDLVRYSFEGKIDSLGSYVVLTCAYLDPGGLIDDEGTVAAEDFVALSLMSDDDSDCFISSIR